jgi:L-fuconate dehydratase
VSDSKITDVRVIDLRFPTSLQQIGSDAVNNVEGHGLTFTLGRGTELCVSAVRYLGRLVRGRYLSSLTDNLAAFSRELTRDSQFRRLGPKKGVVHLAAAALINAVWDLYARVEKKPLWKLLADFEPEQIIRSIDFSYITDVITPGEALALLKERASCKETRLATLERRGYPAYTTSVGWFGFSDDKVRQLCREGLRQGWTHFKLKVGKDPADDLRRASLVREEIGPANKLMMDANQK